MPRLSRRAAIHNHGSAGRSLGRRQFLGATAAATAGALFAAPRLISARSPNDKLNIAMIGCGGRGFYNLNQVKSENIVAL